MIMNSPKEISGDDGKLFEFDFDSAHETKSGLAWVVHIDGEVFVLPKSVVDMDLDERKVIVPQWLADENEMV